MKTRRLLVVSKRFWPVSGPTELLAGAFIDQLASREFDIDVLTWRMIKQWPEKFSMGRCQVYRMPWNQRGGWSRSAIGYYGRNRWHRSLQRWVQSRRSQYDAAVVFEYDDDGLTPTSILARSGIPTISRIRLRHIQPPSRQVIRELQSLSGRSCRLATPDKVRKAGSSQTSIDGLDSLLQIPDGWPEPKGDARSLEDAREILARAHPIFQLPPRSLVAICGASLTFESGVFSLVRSWRHVLALWPNSRLWLVGGGKNAPELYQRICDLDLQHSVLIPGNFDEIRDVLEAADAYIMPGREERPGWYVHSAVQLGLPVIYHQQAPVAASLSDYEPGRSFDDQTTTLDDVLEQLASGMGEQMTTGRHATPDPCRCNKPLASRFPMKEMVDRYLMAVESQVV